MATINTVTISGRIVRDVYFEEFRTKGKDRKKTTFRIASNRPYKDKNQEWQEDTCFIDCKAWGYQAEKLKSLTKGSLVVIQGNLKYDEGEFNERKYKKNFIKINSCILVEKKEQSNDETNKEQSSDETNTDEVIEEFDYDSVV